jgi:hypothetical protein
MLDQKPIRHPDSLYRDGQERECDWCGRTYRPWRGAENPQACSWECFGALLSFRAVARKLHVVELGPMELTRLGEILDEAQQALVSLREALP